MNKKIKSIFLTLCAFALLSVVAFGAIPANNVSSSENNIADQNVGLNISESASSLPDAIKESPIILTDQNDAAKLNSVIAPTLKNEGGQASNSMAQVATTDGSSLITKSNQNDIAVANQNINAITGIK
jgi:hypothetical protein